MQKAAIEPHAADSADREILLELNRNYVRSALESDVRWYSENLSEDFYITAPDGVLLDRDAFLKRIANHIRGRKQRLSTLRYGFWVTSRSFTPVTGIRN